MERRTALEVRAAGKGSEPRRLIGYASVFNSPSEDLGGFIEIVKPGAFKRSLESNLTDPLALVHHMPHLVLGRRSAGTLRLAEDDKGLAFEIDLPDTQTARDLAVSVERGDIRGASFAFNVAEDGDRWEVKGDLAIRELLDVTLHEVTITATPAYPDTEVARRALDTVIRPRPRLALARRFMDTL
ncbi:MAG: HK97 family phage prohead protease [Hyphomicrobiaceae bacterium]|nr:HK97 family phage prohead protease [Hyphomicrobiaceae bacterium]